MQQPPVPNLSPQQQQEVVRYQQLQQSLEMIMQQKATMESQIRELDFAISELESTTEDAIVYKSVGGIFIKKNRNELLENSKERKDTLEVRVKSINKQESNLKVQFESQKKKIQELLGPSGR